MKRNALTSSTHRQVEQNDGDEFGQSGLQEFKDSPVYYEQRSKINSELVRGEWWIAIGVYLIIISIGFVVL